MGVYFTHKGDFKPTRRMFENVLNKNWRSFMDVYGRQGCAALAANTPKRTGTTAASWTYKVFKFKRSIVLRFYNSNVVNGVTVALVLQFGHATRSGGFVEGRDYINPAVRPVFDVMANNAWREVTSK